MDPMRRFSVQALNDVWSRAGLDEMLPSGVSRAELILRYTLSHPHCHTTIVGTCNEDHLAENLAAGKVRPSAERLIPRGDSSRTISLVMMDRDRDHCPCSTAHSLHRQPP